MMDKYESHYREHFFNSRDGLRLFMRQWPVENSKGTVAIVHGFAEHSGRYQHVAEFLNDAGWSVAALDCRGHGQSGGRRAHVDSYRDYIDDVQAFLDEIDRTGKGERSRLIVLGHSQGGLIVSRLIERDPGRASGVVLSSPFFGMSMKPSPLKIMVGRAVVKVLPTLAMKTGLDPAWLSHDTEMVSRYRHDPLVSSVATTGWFFETRQAQQDALQNASSIDLPTLILAAGDDLIVDVNLTRNFFGAVPAAEKELKVYEGYYHEIFNEVERARVLNDLAFWLEREGNPSESAAPRR
jgi:alpha-beta hydrolase superfamily lysophospholipase